MRQIIIFSFIFFQILAIAGCNFVGNKNIPPVSPSATEVGKVVSSSSVAPGLVVSSSISVISASSSSVFFPSSSTTIVQNNPATWPRHYLKELGFSVKLPFENKEAQYGFSECRDGQVYNSDGKYQNNYCDSAKHYFGYGLNAHNARGILILGSVTKDYSAGTGWAPHTIYDFVQDGNSYNYYGPGENFTPVFVVQPIKTLYRQGRLIVVYDEIKDFWGQDERNPFPLGSAVYGIAIKLNGNKIFKAAEIEYMPVEPKGARQQAEFIAESIRFSN